MEIILKQDVKDLGFTNDLVKVRDGFARNFLIPQGLAIQATPSLKKVVTENQRQQAHKAQKLRQAAEDIANGLENKTLKIPAKVGEQGKIFGSINTIMLADAIKELGFEEDRKNITIVGDTIKQIGTYEAQIVFHRDVKRTINFEVVEE